MVDLTLSCHRQSQEYVKGMNYIQATQNASDPDGQAGDFLARQAHQQQPGCKPRIFLVTSSLCSLVLFSLLFLYFLYYSRLMKKTEVSSRGSKK